MKSPIQLLLFMFILNSHLVFPQIAYDYKFAPDWDVKVSELIQIPGGYAMIGDIGTQEDMMFITKLNKQMKPQWIKIIDGPFWDKATGITYAQDGNLVVCGFTNLATQSRNAYVIKLDTSGNVLDEKIYSTGYCEALRIYTTGDGNLLMLGRSNYFGISPFQFFIVKLNQALDTLWTFGIGDFYDYQSPFSMVEMDDGSYIIIGENRTQPRGILLVKLSQDGQLLWQKFYHGAGIWAYDAIKTDGNHFLVLTTNQLDFGTQDLDVELIHFDENGDMDWAKVYKRPTSNPRPFFPHTITRAEDGGFYVTGVYYLHNFLMKVDSVGNVRYVKITQADQTWTGRRASAVTVDPNTGKVYSVWLAFFGFQVKHFQPDGYSCEASSLIPVVIDTGLVEMPFSGDTSYPNVTISPVNLPKFDTTAVEYVACCTPPEAGFSYDATGLTVQFTDTSKNATYYLWDFGDGDEDTLKNPVHTYSAAGQYEVCLVAINNCADDTICETVMVTPSGISSAHHPPVQISYYPGLDAIRVIPQTSGMYRLQLYNSLMQEMEQPVRHHGTVELDMHVYPAGIYFLSITGSPGNQIIKQIVKL